MAKISIQNGKLCVPNNPTLPFIRGDGTGPDIWAASVRVFDAAVAKAYGGKRKIEWLEVFAGETAFQKFNNWLPDETVQAFNDYLIGIKGPLTTPVGKGIRSLNVALRQMLDLYVCLRPVRWFKGVPSPVKHPEKVNMVIFRENTEDIYAGIEWEGGSPEAQKVLDFIAKEFPKDFKKIRFGTKEAVAGYMKLAAPDHDASHMPIQVGIGIKPVSNVGTVRLIKSAIEHGKALTEFNNVRSNPASTIEQVMAAETKLNTAEESRNIDQGEETQKRDAKRRLGKAPAGEWT